MAARHRDPNTLSNYDKIRTTHIDVDFDIDFSKKRLKGNVVLKMKALVEDVKEVVLDSSFLDVESVQASLAGKEVQSKWTVAERSEPYGSPLTINLAEVVKKNDEVHLDIKVNTTDKCTALQWLDAEQTPNKKHPYMFSQCQAIHARSILPCQDTPDVKATVEYTLRSPYYVVAGGQRANDKVVAGAEWLSDKTSAYRYSQPVPVPSYLIAIASGDIASKPIGPRSNVLSGPDEVAGCQWELEADMERFLTAAESIVFEYKWGTFDVLVLPNSFPYGGMENPNATFATPTIISKDRENIDVIAHELAHSWSGNLVTNASWESFWLNEGWTVYLERRILAKLHGAPARDFSAIIGWKALTDSVDRYGHDHPFTALVTDLKGQDPDDAFSSVPYEKGYHFLSYLEGLVGNERWDNFVPHYFRTWAGKSLDVFEFKDTLLEFFAFDADASKLLKSVDWDTWFYKPGLPPKPDFDDSMARVCYDLASKWQSRSGEKQTFEPKPEDIAGWTANQSVVFLESLQSSPTPLSASDASLLGNTYGYATSANAEVTSRYLSVGLLAGAHSFKEPTGELLGQVGRMKFVRPLFRQLNQLDHKYAVEVFERNRTFYHPICRQMVEKDLYGEQKV